MSEPSSPRGREDPDLPPTEEVNPASAGIDEKRTIDVLRTIHGEDRAAWEAVGSALEGVAALVDDVVEAFRRGGRLLYFGAGTSGRLGVLDASECPPTFGVEPWRVQGFIAGGDTALRDAVEGAEDSPAGGARAVEEAMACGRDVVCGIATSGTTPWVWGALEAALRRGSRTALIHCNPRLESSTTGRRLERIHHVVLLPVGPEVISGSTRMKGGTATKLALNGITTAAMVRWGKVYDNLMVDVRPSNEKLRRRAHRLIERLGEVDEERARELFRLTGGRVKPAVVCGRAGLSPADAEELLRRHDGSLRRALEEAGGSSPPA